MEILFNWVGGATCILSYGDLKIAIDPVLCDKGTVQDYFWFKSKRLEQPKYSATDFENIDLWLITHNHEDHLDKKGLSKISLESKLICNVNSYKTLKSAGLNNMTILKWGQIESCKFKEYEISIEAIPAIHGVNPLSAYLAGQVNGYFISIKKRLEESTIYITGDTVYRKVIKVALKGREIDLMIPNMGAAKEGTWIMTLTLNSKMLKKLIMDLQPRKVIPVHYGTFEHYIESVDAIKDLHDKRIEIIEVGDRLVIR